MSEAKKILEGLEDLEQYKFTSGGIDILDHLDDLSQLGLSDVYGFIQRAQADPEYKIGWADYGGHEAIILYRGDGDLNNSAWADYNGFKI